MKSSHCNIAYSLFQFDHVMAWNLKMTAELINTQRIALQILSTKMLWNTSRKTVNESVKRNAIYIIQISKTNYKKVIIFQFIFVANCALKKSLYNTSCHISMLRKNGSSVSVPGENRYQLALWFLCQSQPPDTTYLRKQQCHILQGDVSIESKK